jgi:hypothetical protein
MMLVGLIKMCLNEMLVYIKVHIGKTQVWCFPIQNCLKQDALKPWPLSFALKYAVRKVHENHEEFMLSKIRQLLVYASEIY